MIMWRALSSITFLRQISAHAHQNPKGQVRNLTGETKGGDFGSKDSEINAMNDQLPNKDQNFTQIAREICKITRRKTGWEQTLLSEYPSFNFSDPCFFQVFLKHQNNALLSLRFFNWLCSHCGFTPDQPSCNVLFNALVDAKACNAAKSLLDCTSFSPEPASLEGYIHCLSDNGMVEEALGVFAKLKNIGFCPSIETWNASLLGCLKIGRTDLLWTLYEQLMESGATENIDVKTVQHLLLGFCNDNKVWEGYRLLRQVMEDGLFPDNAVFNSLISGFFMEGEYSRVSELLHIMITKKYTLNIFTYQEVINGLMKNKKYVESLRVFNDLKDRGYFPDRVMYTTMIKGLLDNGWHGEARKLWFEMIQKGFLPNEYTYNAMIHWYCKMGNFSEAWKLYEEMCNRGYRETTVSYNTMISGLCLHGRTDEAQSLFEEMSQKGVVRDLITYNLLIQGLCKKGKLVEATKLFSGLLAEGLKPSASSFTPLIKKFCEVGDLHVAIRLWKDMHDWHLEPTVRTRDHIITALCDQGYFAEGLEWLMEMLSMKLKPQTKTFNSLIQCLSQKDRLDDILLVLDLMSRIGYKLEKSMICSLVRKFGKENFHFAKTLLDKSLERN